MESGHFVTSLRPWSNVWPVVLGLVLMAPGFAHAGLPPAVEAALFAKIMNYDRRLEALPTAERRVLVVYSPQKNADVKGIQEAFAALNMPVITSTVDAAASKLAGVVAVYVADDVVSVSLQQMIANASLLSFSGSAALAEAGSVSVGLGIRTNGRPEIVVNRGRLKAEGHALAANLLAVSRVVE